MEKSAQGGASTNMFISKGSKSKRTKRAGHVSRIRHMRNACRPITFHQENVKGRNNLEELDVDVRIILKEPLKKHDVILWIGCNMTQVRASQNLTRFVQATTRHAFLREVCSPRHELFWRFCGCPQSLQSGAVTIASFHILFSSCVILQFDTVLSAQQQRHRIN